MRGGGDARGNAGRRIGMMVGRAGMTVAQVLVAVLLIRRRAVVVVMIVGDGEAQSMLVFDMGGVLNAIHDARGASAGEHHRQRDAERREKRAHQRPIPSHDAMLGGGRRPGKARLDHARQVEDHPGRRAAGQERDHADLEAEGGDGGGEGQ